MLRTENSQGDYSDSYRTFEVEAENVVFLLIAAISLHVWSDRIHAQWARLHDLIVS